MAELDLQRFTHGLVTVDAVRLTKENLWAVYEWADSKPFYGPKGEGDQQYPITGLTVWEPTGRRKANWGDWVYRSPNGHFWTRPDTQFQQIFQPGVASSPQAEQEAK